MTTTPSDTAPAAVSDVLVRYEQERLTLLREVDLLQLEVSRLRREAEKANARAAVFEAAIDRHMKHCEGDAAAVQRLRAELQDANARRKEQSEIIISREARIQELLNSKPSSFLRRPGGPKLRANFGWLRRLVISARRT